LTCDFWAENAEKKSTAETKAIESVASPSTSLPLSAERYGPLGQLYLEAWLLVEDLRPMRRRVRDGWGTRFALAGWERQQQIPFGDDNQNDNSNSRSPWGMATERQQQKATDPVWGVSGCYTHPNYLPPQGLIRPLKNALQGSQCCSVWD
jgi:hypothetical protein